jgi:hypothetical protein
LKERIAADLRTALRAGDRLAVETCRMLLSSINYEEIEKRRALSAEEVAAILARGVKTRQDAVALYEKGGRAELADKERKEIEIIHRYLPPPLSPDEVGRAVDDIIRELGATSKKDLGRVMKELMARHPGRVDGRAANQIAASRLP